MFQIRQFALAFGLLGTFVPSVIACGDSSNSNASTGDGRIVVGAMAPVHTQTYPLPEVRTSIERAIAAVNERGGIRGRRLELKFCDTKYDPNQEVKCARELAESKVSAVLYPYATLSVDNVYRVFESAKIPAIGHVGVRRADLSSEVSYPLSSGVPGWYYGAIHDLVSKGAKKIAIVSIPSKTAQFGVDLATKSLRSAGLSPHAVATGEINTPDWSAIAARALRDGTDGVLVANTPVDAPRAIAALRASGYGGPITTLSVLLPPDAIAALGRNAEGVSVVSLQAFYSDEGNPAVAEHQNAMRAAHAKITEYSLQAWAAVQLFAKTMENSPDGDAAAVRRAFDGLAAPVDTGIAAPYRVKGAVPPLPEYTRIFNPSVSVATIRNGNLVPEQGFVNPFQLR